MSEEPFRIVQEDSPVHKDRFQARRFEGAIKQENKEELEELKKEEIEKSPKLKRSLRDLKQWYREYYEGLGLPNVDFSGKLILLPYEKKDEHSFQAGIANMSGNYAFVRQPFSEDFAQTVVLDKEIVNDLSDCLTATFFAHEIYHLFPTTHISHFKSRKTGEYVTSKRSGLVFKDRYGNKGNALEEGLAVIVLNESMEVLRNVFPHPVDFIHNMKEIIKKRNPLEDVYLNDNLPLESILIGERDIVAKKGITTMYPHSIILVKYLESQVSEFRRLAERARVLGEVKNFAKEIEKLFGKGSFRLIAMASENNARAVKEELERLKVATEFRKITKKKARP